MQPKDSCEFDPSKLILHVDCSIKGDVKYIGPAVERVMELVQRMKCNPDHHFEVDLALREALANAIEHGCKQDPNKEVRLRVVCEETKGILILVSDPGEGFDPEKVPSPLVGENIYSEGGRGIYLINHLMDEVGFEKGGTQIRMVKRGSAPPN